MVEPQHDSNPLNAHGFMGFEADPSGYAEGNETFFDVEPSLRCKDLLFRNVSNHNLKQFTGKRLRNGFGR